MVAYRRIARCAAVAAVLAGAGPFPAALAAWSADVGYDQNGKLKVALRGDIDGARSIYATCDITRSTILAVLVPVNDPGIATTGMTLSFTFANGARWASTASLYRYDNDLVAVGYGNANDVPAIVAALAAARDFVSVGLATTATGQARSWLADVRGSTPAARKFLDNCFPTN